MDNAAKKVHPGYNTARTTMDHLKDGNRSGVEDQVFSKAESEVANKTKDKAENLFFKYVPIAKKPINYVRSIFDSGKKINGEVNKVNDAYNNSNK